MSTDEISAFKDRARATWAAGDWPSFAVLVWDVGERLVDRVGIESGQDVLDVGCGTGNAAIRAAKAGGNVIGCDLVADHFEAGRELAAREGAEVEFVEGDAEALPFEDASFDVVLSIFGHMFAPRHERAAAELARVLRPNGRIGLCTWIPEGSIGQFFGTIAKHMPPPPDFVTPPPMWGVEDHARAMLEGAGFEVSFERDVLDFRFESAEHAVDEYAQKFGPVVIARAALEPEGKWEDLRSDLFDLFEAESRADEDGVVFSADFLITQGRKTG